MKKFTYFENHGDENGNKQFTICYGQPDGNEIIVGAEDTELQAKLVCTYLNVVLDINREQAKENAMKFGKWCMNLTMHQRLKHTTNEHGAYQGHSTPYTMDELYAQHEKLK